MLINSKHFKIKSLRLSWRTVRWTMNSSTARSFRCSAAFKIRSPKCSARLNRFRLSRSHRRKLKARQMKSLMPLTNAKGHLQTIILYQKQLTKQSRWHINDKNRQKLSVSIAMMVHFLKKNDSSQLANNNRMLSRPLFLLRCNHQLMRLLNRLLLQLWVHRFLSWFLLKQKSQAIHHRSRNRSLRITTTSRWSNLIEKPLGLTN